MALLFSGLAASAFVLTGPVSAPVRATKVAMLHQQDFVEHMSGAHGVGVESPWRPHDGHGPEGHEGYGQPSIAGLSIQKVRERAEMAKKKDKWYGPAAKTDGLDSCGPSF